MTKPLTLAVGLTLGAATLAVVATQLLSRPAAPVVVRSADTARPTQDPGEAWLAAVPRMPAGPIAWDGDELRADLVDEPPSQAIAQLAAATQSVVVGAELMRAAPALTMHWRARDPASAWHLLLGALAEVDIRCETASCRVRILRAIDAAPAAAPPAARPESPAKPDGDTTPSQPDGAC